MLDPDSIETGTQLRPRTIRAHDSYYGHPGFQSVDNRGHVCRATQSRSSKSAWSTSTGDSGLTRSARPHVYRSSIKSPMINARPIQLAERVN